MAMRLACLAGAASLLLLPNIASAAPVTQPYRPMGEQRQWMIEGQAYGLGKVRILINGEVVADGEVKNANFTSTYRDRPVRANCLIGSVRMSGPADRACSVYVDDELAANLVFVRRDLD